MIGGVGDALHLPLEGGGRAEGAGGGDWDCSITPPHRCAMTLPL